MDKKKIAVLVGSLRKDSFNKKIAHQLIKLAPESLEMEIIEIGQLPLYNQDYDENSPKEYTEFREKIKSKDAFLFVTPEHKRPARTRPANHPPRADPQPADDRAAGDRLLSLVYFGMDHPLDSL